MFINKIIIFLWTIFFCISAFTQELRFPKDFEWCVATSAHQIEGDNFQSDWWMFEQNPKNIAQGEKSGKTCNHWNRLEEDTQLLKTLKVKTYRFSIEWAKIEPQEGHWDLEAIKHYQNEIHLLKLNGINPLVTLHHFTLPLWVVQKGSWEWEDFPQAFKKYTDKVLSEIGPEVQDWVTFNEPMVVISGGYMGGPLPPLKKDMPAATRAFIGMLRAHVEAYRSIHSHSNNPSVRVGMAHHLRVFSPQQRYNPLDILLSFILDKAWNWAFARAPETGQFKLYIPFMLSVDETIEGLKGTQDFFGLNYYTRDLVHFSLSQFIIERSVPSFAPVNDLKWEIYPEGFYSLLKEIDRRFPGKPILVTENGIADRDDSKRISFIQSHLKFLHKAIQEGVRVQTYCHWSLMDNFEWAEGFSPRFGLYEVNYSTQERRPRKSAIFFSEIAKTNRIKLHSE